MAVDIPQVSTLYFVIPVLFADINFPYSDPKQ